MKTTKNKQLISKFTVLLVVIAMVFATFATTINGAVGTGDTDVYLKVTKSYAEFKAGNLGLAKTVTAFTRSATAPPSGATVTHLESEASGFEILMWMDGTVAKYYCESQDIFLNPDSSEMFSGYVDLGNIDTANWKTSNVTDMSYMFYNAGYNASTWNIGDLSAWDTSNVTDMRFMFCEAGHSASTFELDLSGWDTSNVTSMRTMFFRAGYNASTWNIGDLSAWDTSKVANMGNMFCEAGYSASTLELGLSGWDTSNVTDMSNMFYDAGYNASTFELDLSGWNTANVTNMNLMFHNSGLTQITIGENFTFKGNDIENVESQAVLPGPNNWKNLDTRLRYKPEVLRDTYDGATMAGTYVKSNPYTFMKKSENTALANVDIEDIEMLNNRATFNQQLKHGEIFRILGLETSTYYEITEAGANNYAPSYTTTAENALKAKDSAESGQSLSVPRTQTGDSPAYFFYNKKSKPLGRTLAVRKTLSGDLITDADRNATFAFECTINGLNPDVAYTVREQFAPAQEEIDEAASTEGAEDIDTSGIREVSPSASGTLNLSFNLKAAGDTDQETFRVEGLPEGATYSIREIPAAGSDYATSWKVTLGSDSTSTDAQADVDTPTETFGTEDIEYTFTNSRYEKHNITLEKKVSIDGETIPSSRMFEFELIGTGFEPNTTYTTDDESITFTTNEAGDIPTNLGDESDYLNSMIITLKANKPVTFKDVPGTAVIQLVEKGVNFTPTITVKKGGETVEELSGTYGNDTFFDLSSIILDDDITVTITNEQKSTANLSIKKVLEGAGVNNSDTFTGRIKFRNLPANTSYDIYGLAVNSLASDANGEAILEIPFNYNTDILIRNLPTGALFQIEEDANGKGYFPSFDVITEGGIEQLNEAGDEGEGIATPWESLATDSEYVFSNYKPASNPTKVVSDDDNVTATGVGTENEVLSNTVENRNSKWTYTVRQEVPAGAESFSITDYLPEYLETILSDDSSVNMVHAVFHKPNGGGDVEGAITKTTNSTTVTTDEGDVVETTTSYNNSAFKLEFDETDVKAKVIATLTNRSLLESGGEAELTFSVFLPQDITIDQLREVGCVSNDDSKLIFDNIAETLIGENEFATNQTRTTIPLGTGLTVKKNVVGEFGDKDEEFNFEASFKNLSPDTEYSFYTPSTIKVNAEYNSFDEEITFVATDGNNSPKKGINITIYEATGDKDRLANLKTGEDGTATVNLSLGDYLAVVNSNYEEDFFIDNQLVGSSLLPTLLEYETVEIPNKENTTKFTADADGVASVGFTLKHGNEVSFSDLPSGAIYNITEAASSLYTASYVVQRGAGTVNIPSAENETKNTALSTGDNVLAANREVTIVFNNENVPKDVYISKVEAGKSSELEGADLKVVDKDGNEIEAWTSTNTPKTLSLACGQEYTLIEDAAPAGYEISSAVKFKINDNGTVLVWDSNEWVPKNDSTVVMIDELSEFPVTIEKSDFDTKALISGASLVLRNSGGTVIHSWRSSDEKGEIVNLTSGIYTLTETDAPEDYQVADPITFTVTNEGLLLSPTEGATNGSVLTMYDKPVAATANITVSKRVGGALGARDRSFSFTGTFSGLKANETYSYGSNQTMTASANGTATATFTLKNKQSVEFVALPAGTTYSFTEAQSNHSPSITITAKADGSVIAQTSNVSTGTQTLSSGGDNVAYVNTRGIAPITGTHTTIYELGLAMFVLCIITGCIIARKRKTKTLKID